MITQSVDTNVLMRAAIDLGDAQTAKARELLADADRSFQVSLVVVAESVYVLVHHYGMNRTQAATTMRWILGIDSLDCPRDLIRAALDAFEGHPQLSFEDCLIAEQAQAGDATPLWTLDLKLARRHEAARLLG